MRSSESRTATRSSVERGAVLNPQMPELAERVTWLRELCALHELPYKRRSGSLSASHQTALYRAMTGWVLRGAVSGHVRSAGAFESRLPSN